MIRAKYSPESENLAKSSQGCKMFHVEQRFDSGNQALEDEIVSCGTFAAAPRWTRPKLFHLERSQLRSSAMRFVCAFLDSERSGGGFPRLSLRGGQ